MFTFFVCFYCICLHFAIIGCLFTFFVYLFRTRKEEGNILLMSKGSFNLERKSLRNVEIILLENQYFCHEVFDLTTILHTENCGKLQWKIISKQRKMASQKMINLLNRKYQLSFFSCEIVWFIFHSGPEKIKKFRQKNFVKSNKSKNIFVKLHFRKFYTFSQFKN